MTQLQTFLEARASQAGIVYCATRASVERTAEHLCQLGYNALPYHAGLSYQCRRDAQTRFQHDKVSIIVATIAFGMGIDKPNVRFVVHFDLPKSIENYYQETGRAGRDGLTADALLLYNFGDSAKSRALIENQPDGSQKTIELHKLNAMVGLAESLVCRRRVLLGYFNERLDKDCQKCDICLSPPETFDATEDAKKILSCIYRLNQNYGVGYVTDVVRGADTQRIKQLGHDRLSTYSLCKALSADQVKSIAQQLIHLGYCRQDIENYNVLKLEPKARPLLRGEEQLTLAVPRTRLHSKKKAGRKEKTDIPHDTALFEHLRTLRRRIADEENKPPFMVFSDASLVDMAAHVPTNEVAFLDINGVGQLKLERYGAEFIAAINAFVDGSLATIEAT